MIMDESGQLSAELILVVASVCMIVLVVAYYTTGYFNEISNHSEVLINNSRDNILEKL
ncbi:MAG: hypothetical protein LUG89_01700 [Methanosphaera sp.]|nr:hypothetical protein [Methanosphaera sp.]